ncbi:hypothetical protein DAETH_44980 (plasmid) [Deinococcus aetherius]|uniref:Uncharacterized protein n=1 Tax=Deinococcus aetherius TaxID=200252 RepID=A0ABM8AL25_9DEIO|nr:hypothetical protein [Deinococcus aetherius]BDP44529.1 hypothetical protein DAETH_44980 [Deinococcus aetherius]
MDGSPWYLLTGTLVAATLAASFHRAHVDWRENQRLLLLVLASAFLWPLVLVMLWLDRQRVMVRTTVPHVILWLSDVEGPTRLRVFRREVRLRWRHRRALVLGPLTLLVRPRPTLDAPLLFAPGRVILTPLLFQVQVLWRHHGKVPARDLL